MSWFRLKSKIPWDWRNGAMGAAGAIVLGFFLLMPGLGDRLAELSFDFPFRLRGDVKPEEAVIIYMNDDSAERLQQPHNDAWERSLHAKLTTNLTKLGAKIIVFDILWETNAAGDKELAAAIKAHGKVVVGSSSKTREGQQLRSGEERRPIEPIRSASQYGIVEFPPGSDRVLRWQLFYRNYTNMSWKVAELFGRAPEDRLIRRWLNFYGPPKSLPKY